MLHRQTTLVALLMAAASLSCRPRAFNTPSQVAQASEDNPWIQTLTQEQIDDFAKIAPSAQPLRTAPSFDGDIPQLSYSLFYHTKWERQKLAERLLKHIGQDLTQSQREWLSYTAATGDRDSLEWAMVVTPRALHESFADTQRDFVAKGKSNPLPEYHLSSSWHYLKKVENNLYGTQVGFQYYEYADPLPSQIRPVSGAETLRILIGYPRTLDALKQDGIKARDLANHAAFDNRSRQLAEVFNRFSDNLMLALGGFQAAGMKLWEMDSYANDSLTRETRTITDFMKVVRENNWDVYVESRTRMANFVGMLLQHDVSRVEETVKGVAMPTMFALNEQPGTTSLLPALHRELVFGIRYRGETIATVAFIYDKSGGARFVPADYFYVQPWQEEIRHKFAAELGFPEMLTMASLVRAMTRQVAYNENLANFGYGQLGVCLDAAELVRSTFAGDLPGYFPQFLNTKKLIPMAEKYLANAERARTDQAIKKFVDPDLEVEKRGTLALMTAIVNKLRKIDGSRHQQDYELSADQLRSDATVRLRVKQSLESVKSFHFPLETLKEFAQ